MKKSGMTTDQISDYETLFKTAKQDLITSSSFTQEQKEELIKNMDTLVAQDFYEFLNVQYQDSTFVASYIDAHKQKPNKEKKGKSKL